MPFAWFFLPLPSMNIYVSVSWKKKPARHTQHTRQLTQHTAHTPPCENTHPSLTLGNTTQEVVSDWQWHAHVIWPRSVLGKGVEKKILKIPKIGVGEAWKKEKRKNILASGREESQSLPCLWTLVVAAGAPRCRKYQTHFAGLMLLWKDASLLRILNELKRNGARASSVLFSFRVWMGLPYSTGTIWHAWFWEGGDEQETKKGTDKIICALKSHFKQHHSCSCSRKCYKPLQEDVCLNLPVAWSKGFGKSQRIKNDSAFPWLAIAPSNQRVPGTGHSLHSTVQPAQICLLTYPNCVLWSPLGGFQRAWRKPHCKCNPLFYGSLLGTFLHSSAREQHRLHPGCTKHH